ncbi:phosphate-responsive 1 family protein [Tripterygium wilfordii]|uniref:Phosphate-responsive 1 family protein n=1 Tax=Tripterygium wilfordii TaxID=458696 RepID=A0A7J7DSA1_TRIWF|nr:protein EXORDIUM-like 6 [Tripterygium wilfordii]KAF5749248.1 phosphate-responsive 1 family protein [Tripterygium wilfordii]
MASSLHYCSLFSFMILLSLSLNAALLPSLAALTYHGGPLLTGNVNLLVIWYGQFGKVQKNAIRAFIKSLNYDGGLNLQPQVSFWWDMVESYQLAAGKKGGSIAVKVVKTVVDANCSASKNLTADNVSSIFKKAVGKDIDVVPVLFSARDVAVQGLCMEKCSEHGLYGGKQPTIVVGNPESECPGECAWPFHKTNHGPQGMTLQPPSGNVGADAMVVAFASSLVDLVTNPFSTGFYQGQQANPIEASSACKRIFGSGAFEGYTGKLRVDPSNGGAFNTHGVEGRKFLLPAIWNPKTSSCWTLL